MDLRELGCDPRGWISLAEDRDQWQTYVRAVITSGFLESQLVSYNINIKIFFLLYFNAYLKFPKC